MRKKEMGREETFWAKVDDSIARVGWHATGVFGIEDAPTIGFTYTTGLDPELLVVGLPAHIAHAVLASLVDAEGTPAAGQVRDDVLVGMQVRLDPVPTEQRERLMTVTTSWRWGARFEALQVVWPDESGVLPGEDGCDPATVAGQKLGAA